MKVVVATRLFPNPTEPFVVDHVIGLTRHGIHTIVTAEKLGAGAHAVMQGAGPGRIELRAERGWRWRQRSDPPWFDQSADIVHFQDLSLARQRLGAVRRLRPRTLLNARGSDVRVAPNRSRIARDQTASVLAAVDAVRCVSAELVERCVELGASPEKVHVSHLGVDLERFPLRPSCPPRNGGAACLVSVGRLQWVKGYEYALTAVRMLRDAGHDVTYTIVGADTGGGNAVRLAIDDLGLDGVVTLAGAMPSEGVREVLARSDLFVLSSVSEGISQSAVEAMAVGVPVVVTDVGGMRELVEDGVHGRVVASRDPAALAEAIDGLLRSASLEEMGRAAAAHVRNRFDAAARIDSVVELYRHLVGTGPSGRQEAPRPPTGHGRPELVSVVVPVLNEVSDLPGQLAALAQQTYQGRCELLVCDNGSSDGSQDLARSWQSTLPNLRVVDASAVRGGNHARNVGIAAAQGDFIALVDAHDAVGPRWLDELVDAADRFDVVAGSVVGLDDPEADVAKLLPVAHGFLPSAPGANIGMWIHVARQVAFDTDLRHGGSEIDFSWRVQLEGFELGYAPEARTAVRRATGDRELARQGAATAASEALLYRKFRSKGMPRAPLGAAMRQWAWVALHLGDLARPGAARRRWIELAAHRGGRVRGSVAERVLFP